MLDILERKVGPRGWIHGWHFVGVPGVGDRVHHPHLGKGTVTGVGGGQVHVRFDSGHAQPFEHRVGPGPGKFVKHGDAMHADAARLAGHAQTARQLAADVRSQLRHTHGAAASSWSAASDYSQGTGDSADKLEEAAGHFDAGRAAEGRAALRSARRTLNIHGAAAQREAYRNQRARSAQDDADHVARSRGIGDRVDQLQQHLTYGFPVRDTAGTPVNAGDEAELLHDKGGTPAGTRGTVAGVSGTMAAMLPHDGTPGINFGAGDVRVTQPAPAGDGSLHHIRTVVAHTGAHQWHTVHGGATRDLYLSQARDRGQAHTTQSEGADLSEAPKGARDLHAHALAHGWDTLYLNHNDGGQEIHHVTATNPDTRTTVKQTWIDGKRDARTPQTNWVNGKQEERGHTPPSLTASMAAISGSPRTSHMPAVGQPSGERAALLARAAPHIDKLPKAVPLADATDDQLRDAIGKGEADKAAATAEDAEYARLRAKYPDGPEHIASLRALEASQGGAAGAAGPFHFTTVDDAGRPAYHTIATAQRRDELTAQARKRGMTVTENSSPHDLTGLPKGARDLHAHATANGWDTSVHTGTQRAGQRPVTAVHAYHPEQGLKVSQGWLENRKQGGEPLQRSMNRIGAARRTEHTASALTPAGEQAWEPLSPAARGEPGAPDEASARNMSDVLGKLRGTLAPAEDAHLSAARDAIATGDHATAADHAAQAVSSLQARSAGDSPAGKAADKVFRWADQRRGNHDQVNYWQSNEKGTFSRQLRNPESDAAEEARQGRQADQDAARAARQQEHDDAVRQRAIDRSPAVRNAASHEQYVRQQRERNRAGFGGSGGTDWKPQTTMGRYSEHRVFNGRQLSISHTPNGVYTARIDGQHIGHHKDRDRAKQMAEDRARGAALGGTTPGARARLGQEPTLPPAPEPPQVPAAPAAAELAAQARADAVHKARQIHSAETTGLNGAAINARDMHAPADAAPHLDAAREHLLNGDFGGADVALGRAAGVSREARNTRAVNAIEGARKKISKAAASPRDTLPPMVAVDGSARADGDGSHTLTTMDHLGREYQTRLGNDGNVTVTHEGRSLTAPAGESPTRVSRELAGQLTAGEPPKHPPVIPANEVPAAPATEAVRPDRDYAAHLPAGVAAAAATPGQLAEAATRGRAVDEALAATGSGFGHAPRDVAVSMARSRHAATPDGPLPLQGVAGTTRTQDGGSSNSAAVDHLGREYHVGIGPTGHVTVASGGRAITGDRGRDHTTAGNSTMDIARDLAGQLNGYRYETPAGKVTKAGRARQPVVSATQGRLVAGTDLAGHAEAGVHLDRAAQALREGDTSAAAGHLAVAHMSLGSLPGELGTRIEGQRAMLGGRQPRLERGTRRVVAEGTHQGTAWQAIEANTPGVTPLGSQYNRYYQLTTPSGQEIQTAKGPGPHAAIEQQLSAHPALSQPAAPASPARIEAEPSPAPADMPPPVHVQQRSYVHEFKNPGTAAVNEAMRAAVKNEDFAAAITHLNAMDKLEKQAGVAPDTGIRPRIAGTISQMKMVQSSRRHDYKELPKLRERQAARMTETANQVITQGSSYTRTTPEQAARVKASLEASAAALRSGDHETALSHLAAAGEAAKGPQGTSVMTGGPDGRGAVHRIAEHQRDVQSLADQARNLAKYAPAAKPAVTGKVAARADTARATAENAGQAAIDRAPATRADLIDKTADSLTQGGGRGGGVLEDTRQSLRDAAAALRAGDRPAAARHLMLADAAGMRTADGHPAVDAVHAHRWDVEGHGTGPLGAQVGSLAGQARAAGSPQVAQHLANAARHLSGGEAGRGREELAAAHALAPGPDEPGGELHDSTDLGTRIRRHIAQLDTVTATRGGGTLLHAAAAEHGLTATTTGQGASAQTMILPKGGGIVSPVLKEQGGRITATNGEEVAPGEVHAYLAAHRQHPTWLSGALLNQARHAGAPGGAEPTAHKAGDRVSWTAKEGHYREGQIREVSGDHALVYRPTSRQSSRVPLADLTPLGKPEPPKPEPGGDAHHRQLFDNLSRSLGGTDLTARQVRDLQREHARPGSGMRKLSDSELSGLSKQAGERLYTDRHAGVIQGLANEERSRRNNAQPGGGAEVKQLAAMLTGASDAHASVRRLLGNAAAALDAGDSGRARGALDMARRYATGELGDDLRAAGGMRLADGTEAWRPIERHLSRLPR